MCSPNTPLLNQLLGVTTTQQPTNAYAVYASSLNIPTSSQNISGRNSLLGGLGTGLGLNIPITVKPQFDYMKELKNIQNTISSDFSKPPIYRKIIPDKSEMKINQGVYVDCACLIVDIRKSSDLTDYHQKRKLAKLYQTFISTTVMILQDEKNCSYINIVGDGVQGFFNTNSTSAYENILLAAAKINSFTNLMNKEFIKNNFVPIAIGIGISTGSVLMTKAGRGNNTDIIWIGDVVNDASKLCDIANKEVQTVAISQNFYNAMPQKYIKDFTPEPYQNCYHSNFVNHAINNYANTNY